MSETYELTFSASLRAVRAIGPWLESISEEFDLAAGVAARVELALVEICNNIVSHGYGHGYDDAEGDVETRPNQLIKLIAELVGEQLIVEITDYGRQFDVDNADTRQAGEEEVHGFGLMIVRQLTDDMDMRRVDDSNIWRLVFPVALAGLARK